MRIGRKERMMILKNTRFSRFSSLFVPDSNNWMYDQISLGIRIKLELDHEERMELDEYI